MPLHTPITAELQIHKARFMATALVSMFIHWSGWVASHKIMSLWKKIQLLCVVIASC